MIRWLRKRWWGQIIVAVFFSFAGLLDALIELEADKREADKRGGPA